MVIEGFNPLFPGAPTGGGQSYLGRWGSIAGTLSDQSDLQAALAAKRNAADRIISGGEALLVAASDAPGAIKARADYVCTGTADNVMIQAALNASAFVKLSEGTFNIAATITPTRTNGAGLVGSGWSTILKAVSGLNAYVISTATASAYGVAYAYFANFQIDGDAANQTAGGCFNARYTIQCLFDHLHFQRGYNESLYIHDSTQAGIPGHHNRVVNCLFDNNNVSAGNGYGVVVENSDENMFVNCDFENNGGLTGDTSHLKDLAGLQHIVGCVFVNGKEGIRLQDVTGTRVVGCMFDGVGRDSIVVSGSRCVLMGNSFIGIGSAGAGAYRGILLGAGPGYHTIIGNTFQSHTNNGQTQRFIQEDGGSGNGNSVIAHNTFVPLGTLSQADGIFLGGVGTILAGNIGLHLGDTTNETFPLTSGQGDAATGGETLQAAYSGAYTVARHNYLTMKNPTLTSGAAVTDAALVRFDAAAGTHKAVDSGGTKTTPGTVSAWVKVNINGTIHYLPAYTSKTS